jgi:hypothetical protein
MKLYLYSEYNSDDFTNHFQIRTNNLTLEFEGGTLFHCNSNYKVYDCIDQLKNISSELVSLCIKLYEEERSSLSWEDHILPLIRNKKIESLLNIDDVLLNTL